MFLKKYVRNKLIIEWIELDYSVVMNTDNMSLSGETIDYGPCAFMDTNPKSSF